MVKVWRRGEPPALLVGLQTGAATVESSLELLQKLKMEVPYDPAIPLLGIYSEKFTTLIQKNMHTPTFIATFIKYNSQEQEIF